MESVSAGQPNKSKFYSVVYKEKHPITSPEWKQEQMIKQEKDSPADSHDSEIIKKLLSEITPEEQKKVDDEMSKYNKV